MTALNDEMMQAWREAADDLGIAFVGAFTVRTTEGAIVTAEGFLPDFGGPDGMVVFDLDREIWPSTIRLYASALGSSYRIYGRAHFIEALDDWGWFGAKDARPKWYRGFV